MTHEELRAMGDLDVVKKLVNTRPSAETAAFIAALVGNPETVQAIGELRRRYNSIGRTTKPVPRTKSGRHPSGFTVVIDPEAFRSFFYYAMRMPLNHIGPAFGRCEGWASRVVSISRAGFYALDDLATAIDMNVDDLLREICPPEEVERLCSQ